MLFSAPNVAIYLYIYMIYDWVSMYTYILYLFVIYIFMYLYEIYIYLAKLYYCKDCIYFNLTTIMKETTFRNQIENTIPSWNIH